MRLKKTVSFCVSIILFISISLNGSAQKKTDSPLDLSLDSGLRAGSSFMEDSSNFRHYNAGFIPGIDFKFNIIKFKILKAGLAGGYLFYANKIEDGTQKINVSARYNRLDLQLFIDVNLKAFFIDTRIGSGLLIFKSDYNESVSISGSHFSNTGADFGFLAGLGFGVEFGKHLFNLNRRISFSVQSDYLRHGNRDDFTLWVLLGIEIIKSKRFE